MQGKRKGDVDGVRVKRKVVKGTQAKNGVRVRAVVSLHVNGANVQSNQGFVCVHKYSVQSRTMRTSSIGFQKQR